jgi:hypothetical protein
METAKPSPEYALDSAVSTKETVAPPPAISFEDSAPLLSWLFFLYLNPLYALGEKKTLEMPDLGVCSEQDKAEVLYAKFSVEYAKQMARPKNKQSLWMALWYTTGLNKFLVALVLYMFSAALAIGPIMLLNNLVLHFQGR